MKYEPNLWKEIKVPNEQFTDFYNVYEEAVINTPNEGVLVEVGSWIGKSTTMMLELLKKYDKKVTFYAVDNFILNSAWDTRYNCFTHSGVVAGGCKETFDLFTKHTSSVPIDDTIKFEVLKTDSISASTKFPNESIDFVFIDADHRYQFVKNDINAWWPKVKKGGIMAGHDFTWLFPDGFQGVGRAVWEFAYSNKVTFSVSNTSWVIKKD